MFSGENVTMEFSCGTGTRVVRSEILDRDMFDPAPKTPAHTSWTMHLLDQIDQAVGAGVLDRPLFPFADSEKKDAPIAISENLKDIASGKYDELYKGAPDRPSDLYRAAQVPPIRPTVYLLSITPVQPEIDGLPGYPPIARLAHIEGTVSFTATINKDGTTRDFSTESGHPMLRPAVQDAVGRWTFPTAANGQTVHGVMQFATNCPTSKGN